MSASLTPPADDRQPLDPSIVEQAIAWHVLLLSGHADEAQRAACEAWCHAHETHERAWQRIAGLGRDMRAAHSGLAPPLALGILRQAAGSSRRIVLKSIAGLGLLGGSLLLARETRRQTGWGADYRTATGERQRIVLADGTQLLLNTASAVDLRFDAKIRQLRLLTGEILIETAADPLGRPFRVITDSGRVEPIGTRFTVRQTGTDVAVAVLEGAVDIHPEHGQTLRLQAGEQTRFDRNGSAAPLALQSGREAWTDGMLVVERMPLGEFVAELDRYRPGKLRCDPAIAELRVSGTYPLDAPDQVLALLAETLPIQIDYFTRYWATVKPRN